MTSPSHIRVLTFNTHVGLATEALRTLMREFPQCDIVCIQEAQSRAAKRRVRRVLRPLKWRRAGAPNGNPAGTIVFVRRRRFTFVKSYNVKVTDGPAAGGNPVRYLSGGVFVHKKTGRTVDVTSVHTWAMGKGLARAAAWVRNGHVDQVRAVARQHATRDPELLSIAAGDWNETLTSTTHNPPSARSIMAKAGLTPTALLANRGDKSLRHLDEVFVAQRPWLRVLQRHVINAERFDHHADHPAVFVDLHVLPR